MKKANENTQEGGPADLEKPRSAAKMTRKITIPIATIGKQAEPEHNFLTPAIIAWSGEDRYGDQFWWWLTCRRVKAGCAELKLWSAGSDFEEEDSVNFIREVSFSAKVGSWQETREILAGWSKTCHLWLPDEILDAAVNRIILTFIPQW